MADSNPKKPQVEKNAKDPRTRSLTDIVFDIYGCPESPLACMIEPKGSVKITSKDTVTKFEELDNIL